MPFHTNIARFSALIVCLIIPLFLGGNSSAQEWDLGNVSQDVVPYLKNAQNSAQLQGEKNPFFNASSSQDTFANDSFFNSGPPDQPWATQIFGNPNKTNVFAPNRTHFQLSVEAVALARSAPTGGAFVYDDTGTALTYEELTFGMDTGTRISARFFTPGETGFELAYYSLSSSTSHVVAGPNVIPFFYNAIPLEPQPSYDVNYDSELDSFELNFWGQSNENWRVGFGYRQFSLRENFDILRSADTTTGFYSDTDNDLFGGQLMLERRKDLSSRMQFFAVAKFGFFHNNVDARGFASNGQVHREDSSFSFVTDINTGLRLTLTENVRIELGYQALLFTGIAIAPAQSEQFSVFDPNFGQTAFANAPFHGLSLGATVAY